MHIDYQTQIFNIHTTFLSSQILKASWASVSWSADTSFSQYFSADRWEGKGDQSRGGWGLQKVLCRCEVNRLEVWIDWLSNLQWKVWSQLRIFPRVEGWTPPAGDVVQASPNWCKVFGWEAVFCFLLLTAIHFFIECLLLRLLVFLL